MGRGVPRRAPGQRDNLPPKWEGVHSTGTIKHPARLITGSDMELGQGVSQRVDVRKGRRALLHTAPLALASRAYPMW